MSTATHRIEFRTNAAEDFRPMRPIRLYTGTAAEMAVVLAGPLASPPFSAAGEYRVTSVVPEHPEPTDMARTVAGVIPDDNHWTPCALGIAAERARMATLLLARAQVAHDRAVAANKDEEDGEAWARAMGEAETLTALAAELIP